MVIGMIYSGYEHGHYFVRLNRDVKMVEMAGVFGRGYTLFGRYMLLIKRRAC